MNNRKIFWYFTKCVENGEGCKRTAEEDKICKRALWRFTHGALDLDDCYKKPSKAKISAYLECESLYLDYRVEEICSSVIGYNTCAFSWAAVWAVKAPDKDGNISIYLRYDTAWHCRLIKVCQVPYEWVK